MPSVLWHCWLGGRKGTRPVKKLSGGVLAWLFVRSKVQTYTQPNWCHYHSLSLASVKSRLVLPFWYRLTWVVPDKGSLNGCMYVCILWYKYTCNIYNRTVSCVKHKDWFWGTHPFYVFLVTNTSVRTSCKNKHGKYHTISLVITVPFTVHCQRANKHLR